MRIQTSFISVIGLCFMLAGCGGGNSSSTQTSINEHSGGSNPTVPGPQSLVVYSAGSSPQFNEIQATNVSAGNSTYDFTFTPNQDGNLTLPYETIRSTLLGCNESDIGLQFNLYQISPGGSISLSAVVGLGPSPVPVKRDMTYVVRVVLSLDRSCLGVSYRFGIKVSDAL